MVPQALLERFPDEFSDPRWRPLVKFLAENPDMQRLTRLMGARILDFDPAAAVSPRRVRVLARLVHQHEHGISETNPPLFRTSCGVLRTGWLSH